MNDHSSPALTPPVPVPLLTGFWMFIAYGVAAEILPFLIMAAQLDTTILGAVARGPLLPVCACAGMLVMTLIAPRRFEIGAPRRIVACAVPALLIGALLTGMNYFTRDIGFFDIFTFFFCTFYLAERARSL